MKIFDLNNVQSLVKAGLGLINDYKYLLKRCDSIIDCEGVAEDLAFSIIRLQYVLKQLNLNCIGTKLYDDCKKFLAFKPLVKLNERSDELNPDTLF